MDVDDVDAVGVEEAPDLAAGPGVHRQLERQVRGHAVHGEPVDDVVTREHLAVPRCRGDDAHLVTG